MALLLWVIIACILARDGKDSEIETFVGSLSIFFACSFIIEFVTLTALVGLLTYFLSKKKRVIHKGASRRNFKKGMCILVTILLIFSSSYLLRVLNDFYVIGPTPDASMYHLMMYTVMLAVPYDLIPLLLVLCLHRRNLKAYKKSGAGEDGFEQEFDDEDGESTLSYYNTSGTANNE